MIYLLFGIFFNFFLRNISTKNVYLSNKEDIKNIEVNSKDNWMKALFLNNLNL